MTSLSTDSPPAHNPDQAGSKRRKGRRSTREKIEKLVAEGAKNYPAYLKLIYTGDSEQSSEEENNADSKNDALIVAPWDAAVTGECPEGAGNAPVHGVVSPESDKLLDPGKEKPPTPTEPSEGAVREPEQLKGEPSTVSTDADNILITDDAKPVNESDDVESQQSMEEKWKIELFQLQDDIVSLKAMLSGKLQVAAELKQRLGITPMTELKHDLKNSFLSIKESGTFARTNAALRSFGAYASRKMGTFRNSVVFKSVEEKLGRVKSRSMGHLKSKLHRKLPASKSESNVGELRMTIDHLTVIDSIEDLSQTDSLTESVTSSSHSQSLSNDILGD